MDYMQNLIKETATKMAEQKEKMLLEQLSELLDRGLLVIEQTQPVLVHESHTNELRMEQSVRLVLRDQEYVEKLEKENTELREVIENLQSVLTEK